MKLPCLDPESWRQAAPAPLQERVSVFGSAVDLRFASPEQAAHLLPPFRHIVGPGGGDAALTILVSDETTHPAFLDSTPWKPQIDACAGAILMANNGPLHMQFNPDSRVFSLVDTQAGLARYHVASLNGLPWYERSAPMRMLLHWMCETNGMTLVHAGAVGLGDACVLLTGRGGSGKSTTAAACALAGMRYLGDDYVALRKDGATAAASLYCSAKVNGDMLARMPAARAVNPGREAGEKAVLFLDAACGPDARRPAPIAAVLAPRVSGHGPAVRRIPALKAFAEISSSTIFQMPGSGQATFRALRELFQDIPVHALDLSPDLDATVRTVRRFLASGGLGG